MIAMPSLASTRPNKQNKKVKKKNFKLLESGGGDGNNVKLKTQGVLYLCLFSPHQRVSALGITQGEARS